MVAMPITVASTSATTAKKRLRPEHVAPPVGFAGAHHVGRIFGERELPFQQDEHGNVVRVRQPHLVGNTFHQWVRFTLRRHVEKAPGCTTSRI
jgi:hypothetical protein